MQVNESKIRSIDNSCIPIATGLFWLMACAAVSYNWNNRVPSFEKPGPFCCVRAQVVMHADRLPAHKIVLQVFILYHIIPFNRDECDHFH